jgi:hypothetical protein
MISAIGVMFLEIGDQFKRCRVHREGFEFDTVETYRDFPVLQMSIDTNEKVSVGE